MAVFQSQSAIQDTKVRQFVLALVEKVEVETVGRTGEILHPCRERLPGGGMPDWTPYRIQHDKERTGPERSAMNLSCGPQVVADQYQQKWEAVKLKILRHYVNGPARESCIQKCNCGDEDEPFVRRRIKAIAEGEIDQR